MAVRAIDAVQVLNNINLHRRPTPVSEFESGFNDGLNQAMWEITRAPALTPPNEWVSVEERLPTDERPVLVFVGYADTMTGFITTSSYFCFDTNPHWQWDGLVRDEQRTLFWMHLPAPPDRRPPEGEEKENDVIEITENL